VIGALAAAAAAQTRGPAFEAASVKPGDPSIANTNIRLSPGGRFTATNVSLRMLLRAAYEVRDDQIVGGPPWMSAETFMIVAKADGDPPAIRAGEVGPVQMMLQHLLADRFGVAVHQEMREAPTYALIAPDALKPGRQLHALPIDCHAPGPPEPARAAEETLLHCGAISIAPATLPDGAFAMKLTGSGITLAQLAQSLSNFTGRHVIDDTGLRGTFDAELTWTPDQIPTLKPGAPEPPAHDPNGLSLFTAIQEQLGLKLESRRGVLDVLVVDRAERPLPD
jgi:uncharacterized protein (TIGR03435 family)